jgi:predicted permease
MDALINVVVPVFGVVLTGYLAGHFGVLGPDSAAALNRFVFYFALPPALFIYMARAPVEKVFNWPFIGAFVGGELGTLLIAVFVGWFWLRQDVATRAVAGLTALQANTVYMGLPVLLTAYGPDGALPPIVATLWLTLVFITGVIAVLEATRTSEESTFRMAAQLVGRVLRNPLVISPLLGILFSAAALPLPKAASNYLDLMAATVGPCRAVLVGAFAHRSQIDGQYRRSHMALDSENRLQSTSDPCADHVRICHGPVLVKGGSHSLGDAHWSERICRRPAIQCSCRDCIVSRRRIDRYVGGHHLRATDLAWGWLSEGCMVAHSRLVRCLFWPIARKWDVRSNVRSWGHTEKHFALLEPYRL